MVRKLETDYYCNIVHSHYTIRIIFEFCVKLDHNQTLSHQYYNDLKPYLWSKQLLTEILFKYLQYPINANTLITYNF